MRARWSSWNHFGGNGSHGNGRLGAAMLREIADAMVSSGLADAGYRYVNLDDGWAIGRHPNGSVIYDPELFQRASSRWPTTSTASNCCSEWAIPIFKPSSR